jgi:hypothetical protein
MRSKAQEKVKSAAGQCYERDRAALFARLRKVKLGLVACREGSILKLSFLESP